MTKKYEFDWKVPVPQPLLDGCLCDRWIESKNDTVLEINCLYKVDENGFFLYWKSEGHEGDIIDLCQVSDVRTGGVPVDSRLLSKLSANHGADLDAKSLTICTNENYIDIEYTHIVFPDSATAKLWKDGLQQITHNNKANNVSARMSLRKHWIRLGFCVDANGKIPVKVILKTFASGKTEKLVYQALKELELPDGKNDSIENEQFTFDKFWELYKKICPRNDIEELFRTITKGQGEGIKMSAFITFMNDFQRDPNMNEMLYPKYDIKRCTEIINDYEVDEKKKALKQLSIEGFTRYLMSDENAPIFLDTLGIHQDMDQPLSHYYINSSHNTYLSGRQFGGKSTVEMYRQTLLAGCRCVELDCWDGADEEPIITHGHAMCTEISYKDVIYAIRDCAFVTSDYPVILSFENHCCRAQQYKMAKYCDEIFGDLLCKEPLPDFPLESGRILPPPSALKNKILIKNKRMKPEVEKAEMELFLKGELKTDDDAKEDATASTAVAAEPTPEGAAVQNAEAAVIAAHTGSTTNVHPWLSSLVNYAEPVHFNGFENAEKKNISHNMSSFAESKGLDYLKTNAIDFVNYNKRQMSRIYPKGTRADSSNYMPQLFWNAGCQMVSLNFQTSDLPMQLNQGKFEYNGGCGYLLKPDFMRRADVDFDPFSDTPIDGIIAQCVKVSVIAGSFLSDKKIGTYVEVDMFGLPSDTIKKEFRTKIVPGNGLNPQYNEDPFIFRKVVLPNLAVLRFGVYDENDKCLGQRILPMDSIQVGYRHISLRTEANFPMSLPSLFVHIDVSIYIPDGFGDFMTALSDPGAFAKAANSTKVKMAALGIEATDAGAAANAIKGQKQQSEPPMVFELVTVDLLKQEKGFRKYEKKNQKELDSARKRSHKERVAQQKKDNANIERVMFGINQSDIKTNADLKKLIQEQNTIWAEMIGRHRKTEYDILKKHLVEQEEQLKVQMEMTQAAQMKQLEDKYAKDMKEKDQANVKANVEMSKEVNFDASVKTKGDKDRRLRELKANALKRFLEEKKTLAIRHDKAKEKLAKAHAQQLADFSNDLKKIIDAYVVEEDEFKACAKHEFFV